MSNETWTAIYFLREYITNKCAEADVLQCKHERIHAIVQVSKSILSLLKLDSSETGVNAFDQSVCLLSSQLMSECLENCSDVLVCEFDDSFFTLVVRANNILIERLSKIVAITPQDYTGIAASLCRLIGGLNRKTNVVPLIEFLNIIEKKVEQRVVSEERMQYVFALCLHTNDSLQNAIFKQNQNTLFFNHTFNRIAYGLIEKLYDSDVQQTISAICNLLCCALSAKQEFCCCIDMKHVERLCIALIDSLNNVSFEAGEMHKFVVFELKMLIQVLENCGDLCVSIASILMLKFEAHVDMFPSYHPSLLALVVLVTSIVTSAPSEKHSSDDYKCVFLRSIKMFRLILDALRDPIIPDELHNSLLRLKFNVQKLCCGRCLNENIDFFVQIILELERKKFSVCLEPANFVWKNIYALEENSLDKVLAAYDCNLCDQYASRPLPMNVPVWLVDVLKQRLNISNNAKRHSLVVNTFSRWSVTSVNIGSIWSNVLLTLFSNSGSERIQTILLDLCVRKLLDAVSKSHSAPNLKETCTFFLAVTSSERYKCMNLSSENNVDYDTLFKLCSCSEPLRWRFCAADFDLFTSVYEKCSDEHVLRALLLLIFIRLRLDHETFKAILGYKTELVFISLLTNSTKLLNEFEMIECVLSCGISYKPNVKLNAIMLSQTFAMIETTHRLDSSEWMKKFLSWADGILFEICEKKNIRPLEHGNSLSASFTSSSILAYISEELNSGDEVDTLESLFREDSVFVIHPMNMPEIIRLAHCERSFDETCILLHSACSCLLSYNKYLTDALKIKLLDLQYTSAFRFDDYDIFNSIHDNHETSDCEACNKYLSVILERFSCIVRQAHLDTELVELIDVMLNDEPYAYRNRKQQIWFFRTRLINFIMEDVKCNGACDTRMIVKLFRFSLKHALEICEGSWLLMLVSKLISLLKNLVGEYPDDPTLINDLFSILKEAVYNELVEVDEVNQQTLIDCAIMLSKKITTFNNDDDKFKLRFICDCTTTLLALGNTNLIDCFLDVLTHYMSDYCRRHELSDCDSFSFMLDTLNCMICSSFGDQFDYDTLNDVLCLNNQQNALKVNRQFTLALTVNVKDKAKEKIATHLSAIIYLLKEHILKCMKYCDKELTVCTTSELTVAYSKSCWHTPYFEVLYWNENVNFILMIPDDFCSSQLILFRADFTIGQCENHVNKHLRLLDSIFLYSTKVCGVEVNEHVVGMFAVYGEKKVYVFALNERKEVMEDDSVADKSCNRMLRNSHEIVYRVDNDDIVGTQWLPNSTKLLVYTTINMRIICAISGQTLSLFQQTPSRTEIICAVVPNTYHANAKAPFLCIFFAENQLRYTNIDRRVLEFEPSSQLFQHLQMCTPVDQYSCSFAFCPHSSIFCVLFAERDNVLLQAFSVDFVDAINDSVKPCLRQLLAQFLIPNKSWKIKNNVHVPGLFCLNDRVSDRFAQVYFDKGTHQAQLFYLKCAAVSPIASSQINGIISFTVIGAPLLHQNQYYTASIFRWNMVKDTTNECFADITCKSNTNSLSVDITNMFEFYSETLFAFYAQIILFERIVQKRDVRIPKKLHSFRIAIRKRPFASHLHVKQLTLRMSDLPSECFLVLGRRKLLPSTTFKNFETTYNFSFRRKSINYFEIHIYLNVRKKYWLKEITIVGTNSKFRETTRARVVPLRVKTITSPSNILKNVRSSFEYALFTFLRVNALDCALSSDNTTYFWNAFVDWFLRVHDCAIAPLSKILCSFVSTLYPGAFFDGEQKKLRFVHKDRLFAFISALCAKRDYNSQRLMFEARNSILLAITKCLSFANPYNLDINQKALALLYRFTFKIMTFAADDDSCQQCSSLQVTLSLIHLITNASCFDEAEEIKRMILLFLKIEAHLRQTMQLQEEKQCEIFHSKLTTGCVEICHTSQILIDLERLHWNPPSTHNSTKPINFEFALTHETCKQYRSHFSLQLLTAFEKTLMMKEAISSFFLNIINDVLLDHNDHEFINSSSLRMKYTSLLFDIVKDDNQIAINKSNAICSLNHLALHDTSTSNRLFSDACNKHIWYCFICTTEHLMLNHKDSEQLYLHRSFEIQLQTMFNFVTRVFEDKNDTEHIVECCVGLLVNLMFIDTSNENVIATLAKQLMPHHSEIFKQLSLLCPLITTLNLKIEREKVNVVEDVLNHYANYGCVLRFNFFSLFELNNIARKLKYSTIPDSVTSEFMNHNLFVRLLEFCLVIPEEICECIINLLNKAYDNRSKKCNFSPKLFTAFALVSLTTWNGSSLRLNASKLLSTIFQLSLNKSELVNILLDSMLSKYVVKGDSRSQIPHYLDELLYFFGTCYAEANCEDKLSNDTYELFLKKLKLLSQEICLSQAFRFYQLLRSKRMLEHSDANYEYCGKCCRCNRKDDDQLSDFITLEATVNEITFDSVELAFFSKTKKSDIYLNVSKIALEMPDIELGSTVNDHVWVYESAEIYGLLLDERNGMERLECLAKLNLLDYTRNTPHIFETRSTFHIPRFIVKKSFRHFRVQLQNPRYLTIFNLFDPSLKPVSCRTQSARVFLDGWMKKIKLFIELDKYSENDVEERVDDSAFGSEESPINSYCKDFMQQVEQLDLSQMRTENHKRLYDIYNVKMKQDAQRICALNEMKLNKWLSVKYSASLKSELFDVASVPRGYAKCFSCRIALTNAYMSFFIGFHKTCHSSSTEAIMQLIRSHVCCLEIDRLELRARYLRKILIQNEIIQKPAQQSTYLLNIFKQINTCLNRGDIFTTSSELIREISLASEICRNFAPATRYFPMLNSILQQLKYSIFNRGSEPSYINFTLSHITVTCLEICEGMLSCLQASGKLDQLTHSPTSSDFNCQCGNRSHWLICFLLSSRNDLLRKATQKVIFVMIDLGGGFRYNVLQKLISNLPISFFPHSRLNDHYFPCLSHFIRNSTDTAIDLFYMDALIANMKTSIDINLRREYPCIIIHVLCMTPMFNLFFDLLKFIRAIRNSALKTNLVHTVGCSIFEIHCRIVHLKVEEDIKRSTSSAVQLLASKNLTQEVLIKCFEGTEEIKIALKDIIETRLLNTLRNTNDLSDRTTLNVCFELLTNFAAHYIDNFEMNTTTDILLHIHGDDAQHEYITVVLPSDSYSARNDICVSEHKSFLSEITMMDVKNFICREIGYDSLIDEEYGMELIVHMTLINLQLPLVDVYTFHWLPNNASQREMIVIYRMSGLGENTLYNTCLDELPHVFNDTAMSHRPYIMSLQAFLMSPTTLILLQLLSDSTNVEQVAQIEWLPYFDILARILDTPLLDWKCFYDADILLSYIHLILKASDQGLIIFKIISKLVNGITSADQMTDIVNRLDNVREFNAIRTLCSKYIAGAFKDCPASIICKFLLVSPRIRDDTLKYTLNELLRNCDGEPAEIDCLHQIINQMHTDKFDFGEIREYFTQSQLTRDCCEFLLKSSDCSNTSLLLLVINVLNFVCTGDPNAQYICFETAISPLVKLAYDAAGRECVKGNARKLVEVFVKSENSLIQEETKRSIEEVLTCKQRRVKKMFKKVLQKFALRTSVFADQVKLMEDWWIDSCISLPTCIVCKCSYEDINSSIIGVLLCVKRETLSQCQTLFPMEGSEIVFVHTQFNTVHVDCAMRFLLQTSTPHVDDQQQIIGLPFHDTLNASNVEQLNVGTSCNCFLPLFPPKSKEGGQQVPEMLANRYRTDAKIFLQHLQSIMCTDVQTRPSDSEVLRMCIIVCRNSLLFCLYPYNKVDFPTSAVKNLSLTFSLFSFIIHNLDTINLKKIQEEYENTCHHFDVSVQTSVANLQCKCLSTALFVSDWSEARRSLIYKAFLKSFSKMQFVTESRHALLHIVILYFAVVHGIRTLLIDRLFEGRSIDERLSELYAFIDYDLKSSMEIAKRVADEYIVPFTQYSETNSASLWKYIQDNILSAEEKSPFSNR